MPIQESDEKYSDKPVGVWQLRHANEWIESLPEFNNNKVKSFLKELVTISGSTVLKKLATLSKRELLRFLKAMWGLHSEENVADDLLTVVASLVDHRKKFYCLESEVLLSNLEKRVSTSKQAFFYEQTLDKVVQIQECVESLGQELLARLMTQSGLQQEVLEKALNVRFGMKNKLCKSSVASLKQVLRDTPTLVVVGDTNSGKSSFINGLLGMKLLPSEDRPCTNCFTKIRYGERARMVIMFHGQESKEIEFQLEDGAVAKYLDKELCSNRPIRVDIFAPLAALRHISFIDTPGFNDSHQTTCQVLEVAARAESVLLIINATATLGQTNKEFLSRIEEKRGTSVQNLLFVCNKIDCCENPTVKKQNLAKELLECFPSSTAHPLICTSSKIVVEARTEDFSPLSSEFVQAEIEFCEFLERTISSKILTAGSSLRQTVDECRAFCSSLTSACSSTKPCLQSTLAETQQHLQEWRSNVSMKTSQTESTLFQLIGDYVKLLCEQLTFSKDIHRKLDTFIDSKCKDLVTSMYFDVTSRNLHFTEIAKFLNFVSLPLLNGYEVKDPYCFHAGEMGVLGSIAVVGSTTATGLCMAGIAGVAGATTATVAATGGLAALVCIPVAAAGIGVLAGTAYLKNHDDINKLKQYEAISAIVQALLKESKAKLAAITSAFEERIIRAELKILQFNTEHVDATNTRLQSVFAHLQHLEQDLTENL